MTRAPFTLLALATIGAAPSARAQTETAVSARPDAPSLRDRLDAMHTPRTTEREIRVVDRGPGSGTRVSDVATGVALTFRLVGARPTRAATVGAWRVFEGALGGGTRVAHRVGPAGVEDVVELERRPAVEELRYELSLEGVAAVRVVGRGVELLDGQGAPRVRMAPPYAVDARGRRLELDVEVTGCAYDTDPRGPWGRRLVAPGSDRCVVSLRWSSARYPLVIDPVWTATDSLATARSEHAIAFFPASNTVLVAGGNTDASFTTVGATATAELYSAATSTWAMAMPLTVARANPAFVRISDTVLLVAGGASSGTGPAPVALASSETYDAGTGMWTTRGDLGNASVWGQMVRLANGDALLAGGKTASYFTLGATATANAYRYAAATGMWSAVMPMRTVRYGHFVFVTLTDGRVLAAGGWGGTDAAIGDAEIYDAATNQWSMTGSMATARSTQGTRLGSGDVMAAGGSGAGGSSPVAEIFRVGTGTWETVAELPIPTSYRATGVLTAPDGVMVLVGAATGGLPVSARYDEAADEWGWPCPGGVAELAGAASVLGAGGTMFITGGVARGATRAAAARSGMRGRERCDDRNPCTDDMCVVATGCASTNNSAACDDGNACTMGEMCAMGSCGGGAPVPACTDGGMMMMTDASMPPEDTGTAPMDADMPPADAGLMPMDAGRRRDAGGRDAGPPRDIGPRPDLPILVFDTGVAIDAGARRDAGGFVPLAEAEGGCGCATPGARARAPEELLVGVVAAAAIVRRRRRAKTGSARDARPATT